jgi:hypothetical protein
MAEPDNRELEPREPESRVPESRVPESRRRILVRAGIAAGAASLLFGIAVVVLNLTVFSPSGFVTTYLQTLGERNVSDALGMPGVELPGTLTKDSAAAALLEPTSLASITDITTTNDVDLGNGVHRITARYLLAGAESESTRASSQFLVRDAGMSFLFFHQWRFETSPVATLQVHVANGASATVGTSALTARELGAESDQFSATADFPVLVPGLVVLSHESHYLTGIVVPVLLATPGESQTATVAAAPNTAFIAAVTTSIHSFLDDCAMSTSLFPPGCPFSKQVSDRIVGDPVWSITAYPPIGILSAADSWIIAQSGGIAHITVDVRSLFDGSVTTLDEAVPFRVDYRVLLAADDTITFAAR